MAKPAPGKILRIGIIQSGKIIEERLLRSRNPVTIGQSPKNTFVIPVSNLPRSATLFDLKKGTYTLAFKEGMDGRVSVEGGVMDFGTLKTKGVARRRGDTWRLELTEKSRGKVVLGDVTLLFQFVTPPPAPPKLQLPAAARGGWVKSIEWHFVGIIMASFFVQAGAIGFLVMKDWPEIKRSSGMIPDRFVSLLAPAEKAEEPKAEVPKDTTTDDDAGDEKVEKKEKQKDKKKAEPVKAKKAADPEQQARAAAAKKRALAKKVRSQTLLKFIGSVGGAGPGQIADALSGGATRSKIDEAFAGATGVAAAVAGQDRSRKGGAVGDVGGLVTTIGDLKAARKGKVKGGPKKAPERSVRANIKTSGPSSTIGTGKLDTNQITSVVKRRQGAIKSCYERELKKNPNLGGKITVQFTIGQVGRVTSAKVTVNTTGSAAVANCIKQRIARWRFPKPEGGDVTVAYPFIFTASQ